LTAHRRRGDEIAQKLRAFGLVFLAELFNIVDHKPESPLVRIALCESGGKMQSRIYAALRKKSRSRANYLMQITN
jgi:hypothetical protein